MWGPLGGNFRGHLGLENWRDVGSMDPFSFLELRHMHIYIYTYM